MTVPPYRAGQPLTGGSASTESERAVRPGHHDYLSPPDQERAKTFDDSLPGDHTQVVGKDRYYQIWFGHRMAYVRAADVDVAR